MSKFTDPVFLTMDQYRDARNLEARLAIHPRFSTNSYGWFNWIFDSLSKLSANARILELGCGNGQLWRNIAGRNPAGWNITLSDLSEGMLDAAWRNLVVTGRSFKFEQIDAQSIPYEDEAFDAVIANHMLYHVHDREKALLEIRRVLKMSGRLFATTVGGRHMQEMDEWRKRVTSDKYSGSFSASFTLENGMEQLTPFFSEVRLSLYKDNLHVTEVEPIIAYICSVIDPSELDENELAKLRSELEVRLFKEKMIFITKDSGLFEAVKVK